MFGRIKKAKEFRKLASLAYPRVSVTGIRGKSSQVLLLEEIMRSQGINVLAKITGDYPQFIKHGERSDIKRHQGYPVLLDENIEGTVEHGPFDSLVFENQAIAPYTMKIFHNLIKPTHILVMNLRRDHAEFLGETREEITRAFGAGLAHAKVVISGEQDTDLNSMLKQYCSGIGASFYIAEVPSSLEDLPGIERVFIAKKLMELLSLESTRFKPMSEQEIWQLIGDIDSSLAIERSSAGIEWFDAAKVNDIDSSSLMFANMVKRNPGRSFALLAYFRRDRPDRTISFVRFFNELMPRDCVSQVFLAGFGGQYVYHRLSPEVKAISQVLDSSPSIGSLRLLLMNVASRNEVLVTLANAVNPFMRELRSILREPAVTKEMTPTVRVPLSGKETGEAVPVSSGR